MAGNYRQVLQAKKKELAVKGRAIARDVAFQLFNSLVILTPVDTTRAEANWEGALNTVSQEFVESRRNSFGNRANLETVKQLLTQMKTGDVFVAANSTPYIFRLEHGWSQQAPNGMVAVTVALFQQMVKRAAERAVLRKTG